MHASKTWIAASEGSLPPPNIERAPRILVFEATPRLGAKVRSALAGAEYDIVVMSKTERVVETLEQVGPDLLVLDVGLTDPSAFELCGELRATEIGQVTPILLLAERRVGEQQVARGLGAGADDVLTVSERLGEFHARVRAQLRSKRDRDRLRRLRLERDAFRSEAVLDPLTGIPNRRSLGRALTREIGRGAVFSVVFADVDHFKSVNDTFGHDVGDQVLRAVAGALGEACGTGDVVGRHGGEEFLLVLPGADATVAAARADRCRRAVEALPPIAGSRNLTASFGVASFSPGEPDANVDALTARADAALYEAKEGGRNRVVMAAPCEPSTRVIVKLRPTVEGALLRELASGHAGLPMLPESAIEAMRLAEDPRSDMADIARLVEHDPPLAARFVAIAGSVAYSRGVQTKSVQAALVRIGLAAARDLLLQAVYERSNADLPRYQDEVTRSFERCVRTAVAARCITKHLRLGYEDAYLCGLLHDIGESRIYRILSRMRDAPAPGAFLTDLVARHHARAGAEVARTWKLPSQIVDVCARHHEAPEAVSGHVRVVIAAETLVKLFDARASGAGAGLTETGRRGLAAAGLQTASLLPLLVEMEGFFPPVPAEAP